MPARRLVRSALSLVLALVALGPADARPAEDPAKILAEYLSLAERRGGVAAELLDTFGRPFVAFTEEDYARFLADLDLSKPEDLLTWSLAADIPVVALSRGYEFLRANAHLLADPEAAQRIPPEELGNMRSRFRSGQVTVTDAGGAPLPVRDDAAAAMRAFTYPGQVRVNKGFADDLTAYEFLSPYLVPLREIGYLAEVGEGLRALPLSIVKVLAGKALYLTTGTGGRCDPLWHCLSGDLHAEFAGMQIGVVLEEDVNGLTAENLVRGLARLVRETVLETQYFGIYAYPRQFPAFQKLTPARRRVFGRRRDRLPPTPHGYISERARRDPQANFVEHLTAWLLVREDFRKRAEQEAAEGHPELAEKFDFMETLVGGTPTTMEPLSRKHLARFDREKQRAILAEYQARQAAGPSVRAAAEKRFGKPFPEFTGTDYATLMRGLDLNDDADLWKWSHVTGIPVVGLSKRSNFFHLNAHLLADVRAANLMTWEDLHDLATTYDEETGRITVRAKKTGVEVEVRKMPADTVRPLETTGGLRHNRDWAEDRITFEALEFCLVRLSDLENREDLSEALRMLPLTVVKAHRGKAIYPTTRSRTGWAFTWRVSNEENLSYIGLIPGSLAECRRDAGRARIPPEELVKNGRNSLSGNSTDSVIHEIGHVIDLNVLGARNDHASHPFQFPEMRKLVLERHRIFAMTTNMETGYVSAYSKVNPQENFAEHFWAYLRDPAGFSARADQEAATGNDLLLRKYRFMEKLIVKTPATMHRLSPGYLAQQEEQQKQQMEEEAGERGERQAKILAEYLARFAERDAAVARITKRFGKPFHEFTREDYAAWLGGLDFGRDADLFEWSHVTGIPVLALCRTSSFFSSNTHLLADVPAALRMTARESYALKTEVDQATGRPVVRDPSGAVLPLRDLPEGILLKTARTKAFWHYEGFREARTVPEVLAPYLLPFGDLPYRDAIDGWIRMLPLSVVQIYRGKGIYFTPLSGRSFAPTMPASNTTYKSNVGMQTGLWVEIRRGPLAGTAENFIHEFGHIVDYVILKGGYGNYRAPHQFPEFRKLLPEKQRVFGSRDEKVPQTPYGYISRYAMTNAQEGFAEHFRAYITEQENFREKAETERAAGHPELMQKYRFMEEMIDRSPTTMRRLSAEFLARDARWTGTRQRITRLKQAAAILGNDAPKALARLIEAMLATAFTDPSERAAAAEIALLGQVTRAVVAVKDEEKAQRALAAILGLSLELKADRGATVGKPSFTAVVRGADEGEVTGTLLFGTRTPGRFGPPAEPTKLDLGPGAVARATWQPDSGEDLSPFDAEATANLTWRGRRFTLKSEIVCRPSIPAWNVIGPFDNAGGATGDVAHPPEKKVDLLATYDGREGARIGWRAVRRPATAKLDAEFVLDLANLLGPAENAAAYAVVWVFAPKATEARLAFGSADGVVVWVNGKREYAWLKGRRDYRSRTDQVPIRLKKGANEILIKVTLTAKEWKLGAHLTDPAGRPIEGIRYSLTRRR